MTKMSKKAEYKEKVTYAKYLNAMAIMDDRRIIIHYIKKLNEMHDKYHCSGDEDCIECDILYKFGEYFNLTNHYNG